MKKNEIEIQTQTVDAVHATAARGFTDGNLYERGRPDYPAAVVTALDVTSQETIVDLGCGTGKLTRLLKPTGARLIGVEPLPAMRTTFRQQCPDIPLVTGVAERLPLRTSSCDAVTCASAFHWFDHDLALPEIHRVLRAGGRLGIVWNRRDNIEGWPADFWAITEAYRGATPGYRTGKWREAIERHRFGPITEHWFDYVQRADVAGLLDRVGSASFIEILPAAERDRVMTDARRFLETHPETRGRDVIELPYRTAVYITQALE